MSLKPPGLREGVNIDMVSLANLPIRTPVSVAVSLRFSLLFYGLVFVFER